MFKISEQIRAGDAVGEVADGLYPLSRILRLMATSHRARIVQLLAQRDAVQAQAAGSRGGIAPDGFAESHRAPAARPTPATDRKGFPAGHRATIAPRVQRVKLRQLIRSPNRPTAGRNRRRQVLRLDRAAAGQDRGMLDGIAHSRTLPYQGRAPSSASVAGVICPRFTPELAASTSRKKLANSATSSRRSRRLGMRTWKVFSRKNKSWRNRPAATALRRS